MKPSPWLSVIVPTYQGEKYITDTLESIADQWKSDIEVIAIDDGSSDATLEILRKYQSRIGLKLLDNTRSGNWVQNSNKALHQANGKYLCMLHQDDMWLASRISTLRKATEQHPDAGMFINSSIFINESGRQVGKWNIPLPVNQPLDSENVLTHLVVQNFIAMPSPIFKRDVWLSVEDMDESLWFLADWKLWGTIAAKTKTVMLPEILTAYRVHSASQTTQRTSDADDLWRQYKTVILSMADQLDEGPSKTRSICAAELNACVCISMALWSHKERTAALRGFLKYWLQSPAVWHKFFRDSRIHERLVARLRA